MEKFFNIKCRNSNLIPDVAGKLTHPPIYPCVNFVLE